MIPTRSYLKRSRPAVAALITSAIAVLAAAACRGADARTITVFSAGALAKPLRAALDTFARPLAVRSLLESAGSLETVRKITELGKTPDVVALADTALFSSLLRDRVQAPIIVLGSSRMVLAYTRRSRFASEIDSANWWRVVQRPGVEMGRSDPSLDPAGYRSLMVYQLAERLYRQPGLTAALTAASPARNIRAKSADLVALVQSGNMDYAWEYESVARSSGLRYLRLPREIDLGDSTLAPAYAFASVRVKGSKGVEDSVTVHGATVVFGAASLRAAPSPQIAHEFITFLMSQSGAAALASGGLKQ